MPKVVIAENVAPSAIEQLEAGGIEVARLESVPRAELLAGLRAAQALIVRSKVQVDAELLAAAPELKAVGRAGVGVDNIDLEAASRRGVIVFNSPGGSTVSVAEHTFALILALARHIPLADRGLRERRWEKNRLVGLELMGKTLGLIGLGRIGREVAVRARAFGMNTLAHDPFVTEVSAAGVRLVDLETLLAEADIVSLHAPLSETSSGLLDAKRLAAMRPGALLINCARAGLIDESALLEALESGRLGGAALDVFPDEPQVDPRLLALPQVVLTPHIAGSTVEAQEKVGLNIARALRDYLLHGAVGDAVNVPPISGDQARALAPYLTLAQRLGRFMAQIAWGPVEELGIRYFGEAAHLPTASLTDAVLCGLLQPMLDVQVNRINARRLAQERGIPFTEARSTQRRDFTGLISIKLKSAGREDWAEGAVLHGERSRLVAVDGIDIESPLRGHMLFLRNRDVPGVIGRIGTLLAEAGINIGSFALGRRAGTDEALAIVGVDSPVSRAVLAQIAACEPIKLVRPLDFG
jgi:D-3-phosphoglycerate dehydrogenase